MLVVPPSGSIRSNCLKSTGLPFASSFAARFLVASIRACCDDGIRRRTFICCRNAQISTSSAVRDRNRSATIQTMRLTSSHPASRQEQRPILDQLLVRLSLRKGQPFQTCIPARLQPPWRTPSPAPQELDRYRLLIV